MLIRIIAHRHAFNHQDSFHKLLLVVDPVGLQDIVCIDQANNLFKVALAFFVVIVFDQWHFTKRMQLRLSVFFYPKSIVKPKLR